MKASWVDEMIAVTSALFVTLIAFATTWGVCGVIGHPEFLPWLGWGLVAGMVRAGFKEQL